MQHVQYDAVKRSACISKLASRDMRTKHDTQHSDAHLAIKVDYSEDMRRLKLKSKIEVLLVRLRERVGQSFMNPCRIIRHVTQRRGTISCMDMYGISCLANEPAGAEDVEGEDLCVRTTQTRFPSADG